MELELNRNQLSCYDTVLDTTVFHEETMEMIVPDACPDILHLVDTCGTVCLKGREAQEGRVEVSGSVRCAVLYLPDGGNGIHRVEVNIPFVCAAENAGIRSNCSVMAVPRVQAAETRVLNPRKVLVRVNLAVALGVFAPCDTELCTGAQDTEERGVQQLLETQDAYVVSCVQEKPFNFSDDLTISGSRPEAEELLKSRVTLNCNESKIIGNKLIFKGEALLQLLYRSTEGATCGTDFELPFSQIMEVSGVEEEADCAVDVQLTDFSCALEAGDGRTVSVSMGLLAQAVVRETRSLELLSDIYSVSQSLSASFETYSFNRLVEQGSKRQSVREIVETSALARAVSDAYVAIGAVTQTRDGSRLTVSAEAAVTVVYETEVGELSPVTRTITVPCSLELPEGCACTCQCSCPGAVFATPTTGGVEIRLDLDFRYIALTSRRVVGVSGVQVEEGDAHSSAGQPSIVLRMVGPERLWDIAKSYGTTTEDIMRANELAEGDALSGRLLLIPKKR